METWLMWPVPQIWGGLLMALSVLLAWIGSERGWWWTVAGFLCFVVGFAAIGVW